MKKEREKLKEKFILRLCMSCKFMTEYDTKL